MTCHSWVEKILGARDAFISGRLPTFNKISLYRVGYLKTIGALQIVVGWCPQQPGRAAVGGVSTAHTKQSCATIIYTPCCTLWLPGNCAAGLFYM